jgi:hypothetical protein
MQTVTISFIPDDTANYNSISSQSIQINVKKADPVITWSNPVDIVYGTALDAKQLGASCPVPGTLTYTPAAGTVLNTGNGQTLSVTFTPTDTANYNTASKDVKINVKKADPVITWSNPADITYGTALSAAQLNAQASVAGTLKYTPDIGASLNVGDGQTLSVTFTPDPSIANNYNTASKDVTINVIPPPTINSITIPVAPVPLGTTITSSASVDYQGSFDSSWTAIWDWGDGSTSQSPVSSNIQTSHLYNSPDVYTVSLTLNDNGVVVAQKEVKYVVVYDTTSGFVTGGGWINSPAGAYAADTSLTGKANFGFNSKYQKGANVPIGNTEFDFKVANLNFHSSSYDWLVVAGAKAQYKGTGTINGQGQYKFILTALDGQVSGGGGTDKFRIKIWDKTSGNIVYDNMIGADDTADPITVVQKGSIIIHKE